MQKPDPIPVDPPATRLRLLVAIFGLFALLFGGLAFLVLQSKAGPDKPRRHVLSAEMVAPDFALPAQDGRVFHLKDYRGRAVFVAFLPRLEDPEALATLRSLKATLPEYEKAGGKVFAVTPEGPAVTKAVYAREKLPFPLLTDAGGATRRAYTVPDGRRTTFVVDPKGEIKFRIGDAMIEPERHGPQLLEISKCCLDEVIAARAGGIGKPVGDYSLPRADGGGMETVYGDGRQLATAVLFISAKCPCSASYNDRMRQIATEFGARGVRFVAVYSNADETPGEVVAHARAQRFPFAAVFTDPRGLGADHFKATVTPQVFVVDSKRVLRYGGRIDDSRDPATVQSPELRRALEAVLTDTLPPDETNPYGCSIVRN
jgi:peroxiredoxin